MVRSLPARARCQPPGRGPARPPRPLPCSGDDHRRPRSRRGALRRPARRRAGVHHRVPRAAASRQHRHRAADRAGGPRRRRGAGHDRARRRRGARRARRRRAGGDRHPRRRRQVQRPRPADRGGARRHRGGGRRPPPAPRPTAAARGATGATTVAATAHVAAQAGIGLFATGGLGGVHREAAQTWDESADLVGLARTRICVVCAGVKSILDIPATLERLETLGIGVAGYRTTKFPAFYLTESGYELPWRLDSPEEIAAVLAARGALGLDGSALVIANPLPVEQQLDPDLHQRVLDEALAAAAAEGVRGRDVTPFLLARFHAGTGGESLGANVALVLANARLAGAIAAADAARGAS